MSPSSQSTNVWTYFLECGNWLTIFIPLVLYQIVCRSKSKNNAYKSLEGKVVLLTGASQGLGEALAHGFYKAGCKVILAARSREKLIKIQQDLSNLKVNTVRTYRPAVLVLDVSDIPSIPNKFEEAKQAFGPIDMLVNNAGISCRGEVAHTEIDVHMQVMQINYFGGIALTKAVLPEMMERQRGHIVGVSSVQGRISIPHRSAYAASKHASQAFYDALRSEVKDKGINVTVVSPGYIRTNLSVNAVQGDGSVYGVTDETTANGLEPEVAANRILQAVALCKKEVVIASFKIRFAILIRTVLPSLFFWLMARRAKQ